MRRGGAASRRQLRWGVIPRYIGTLSAGTFYGENSLATFSRGRCRDKTVVGQQ
jgi:hypothetical protein